MCSHSRFSKVATDHSSDTRPANDANSKQTDNPQSLRSSEHVSPVRSSRGFGIVTSRLHQAAEVSSPLGLHSNSRDHEISKISVDKKQINFRLRQDSAGDLTDADSPLTIQYGKNLPPLVRRSQPKDCILPFQTALDGVASTKRSTLASSRLRVRIQDERSEVAERDANDEKKRLLEYLRNSNKNQRSHSTFKQSLEKRDSTSRVIASHRITYQSSERLSRLPELSSSCLLSAGRLGQSQPHPADGEGLLKAYEKRIESMRRELEHMRTEL